MGQHRHLGCCSAMPSPSSPGHRGPRPLSRGAVEVALHLSGSRSCKERKGRSRGLGMSRVAKSSRRALPLPSPPLHSRAQAACGLRRHHLPSQLPACHPAGPGLASPHPLPPPPQAPSPPPGPRAAPRQGQQSKWGWAGWAPAPWGAGRGGQWAGGRRARCQDRFFRTSAGRGLRAESRGELGGSPAGVQGQRGLGWGTRRRGQGAVAGSCLYLAVG